MNTRKFLYRLIIQEKDLDSFGHVNNAAYLVLFEQARWDLLNQNGFDFKKMQEAGLGPTIMKITVSYLKELRLNDEIQIETQIVSYEGKVGKIFQRMLREEQVCCEAEIVMGLFDLTTRKLVLPTPEWLAAIGVMF